MSTAAAEGFEAGIMRRTPAHPYIQQSSMERDFMDGFKRGRARRTWLDSRGQKRVRNIVWKNGVGDWHWEVQVENSIHAQGWAKSERAANQACEDANMDRIE